MTRDKSWENSTWLFYSIEVARQGLNDLSESHHLHIQSRYISPSADIVPPLKESNLYPSLKLNDSLNAETSAYLKKTKQNKIEFPFQTAGKFRCCRLFCCRRRSHSEVTRSHSFQQCIKTVAAAPANAIHHLMDDDLSNSSQRAFTARPDFICIEGDSARKTCRNQCVSPAAFDCHSTSSLYYFVFDTEELLLHSLM